MSTVSENTVHADSQEPWLGLESYTAADANFFKGRDDEREHLLRMVRREVLTVLFGPSGTGKTSLLKAGLFPRLETEACLPVYIRLAFSQEAPTLGQQVRIALKDALAASNATEETVSPSSVPAAQETLWEYFHRVDFWDRNIRPLTPILCFDQFEEVFTLGRDFSTTADFLIELADLIENHIPASIAARLERENSEFKSPFPLKQQYKVLISLREDFVHRLDEIRTAMPSIMHNRYALRPMNGEQAIQAVQEPGRDVVEEGVPERIVRLVAARNDDAASSGKTRELRDLEVEPALLSVICRELNTRRLRAKPPRPRITAGDVATEPQNILQDLYERSFEGLAPPARLFVEERLLDPSGFRNTVPLEDALRSGVAGPAVETLVRRRLLRIEERLGRPHIELTHDVLTKVVRASREQRHEREKRTEAEQLKLEAERKKRSRLLKLVLGIAGGLTLLFAIAATYFGFRAASESAKNQALFNEAQRAQMQAEVQREEAVAARQQAVVAREQAEDARRRADEAAEFEQFLRARAEDARIRADQSRAEAEAQKNYAAREKDRADNEAIAARKAEAEARAAAMQAADAAAAAQRYNADLQVALAVAEKRQLDLVESERQAQQAREKAEREAQIATAAIALPREPVSSAVNPNPQIGPKSDTVLTIDRDGYARVWDASTRKKLFEVNDRGGPIIAAVFNRNGDKLAVASASGQVKVVSFPKGSPLATLQTSGPATILSFFPGDASLLVGSQTFLRVLDLKTEKELYSLGSGGSWAGVMPDGKRVIVGHTQGEPSLWRLVERGGQQIEVPLTATEGCVPVQISVLNYSPVPGYRVAIGLSTECLDQGSSSRTQTAVATALTPSQAAILTGPVSETAQPLPRAEAGPPVQPAPRTSPQAQPPRSSSSQAAQRPTTGSMRARLEIRIYDAQGNDVLSARLEAQEGSDLELSDVIRRGFDEKQLRGVVGELAPFIKKMESATTDSERLAIATSDGGQIMRRIAANLNLKVPQ